jgi:hypothetical protein
MAMEPGYHKNCKKCGTGFTTRIFQQVYCDGCGKNNKNKRATDRASNILRFVGVDGEGVDRPDGKHEYVMLSVGDKTLWDSGKALTLRKILSFLWECYCADPDAAYVGFFLGYDFIQWEKLLPEPVAYSLLTTKGIAERKSQRTSRANPYPDAVVWEGWELDIMAGRRFKLRPHVHHASRYNSLCRNRTCRKVLDDGPEFAPDEPATIHEYEVHWQPPEVDYSPDFTGSAADFWERAMPRMHMADSHGATPQSQSGWLYICDTGPFWQTSFLNVINPKGWPDGSAVCSTEEYELICRGKAERGNVANYGDVRYFDEMRMYNVLENEILARVTTRLNEGFMNDAIPIKLPKADWYGPGRAAQIWMDLLHARVADPDAIAHNKERGTRTTVNAPTGERRNEGGLLNADVYMSMPAWFADAARASYYGGWFEQFVHGHCGDVWEYDINSAYPFIIATLPCLHTTFPHTGSYRCGDVCDPIPEGGYTLLFGTVTGSNPYIGAMPYRTRDGRILRPHITKGWYWAHEIEAAKRAGLIDTVDTEEWVSYQPCTCTPPFNPDDIGIERMYRLRLDSGKNSPQGKALKLVYNSAYGKTAQSIGSPKYSNPVYASLITAGCRTLILDSIATHPKGAAAVTMVATDGIYFLEQHPSLPLSPSTLGLWDETFKPNMTQLMPGVYWDDNTRETIRTGAAPKLKSRGVNAKDLASQIALLDGQFAQAHMDLANGGEYDWPSIEFKVNFLLHSAKLALQRGKWDTAGKVEHGTVRRISANPVSKRIATAYRDNEWGGITRTHPYERGNDIASTPYNKAFGYVDESDLFIDKDGGDGLQYFRDLIKGSV